VAEDLSTLKGIAAARAALYQKLTEGKVTDQQAAVMEKILRGQVHLKGELPLSFIKALSAFKDSDMVTHVMDTVSNLSKFLDAQKALGSGD
jgi:hypothetical protein